MASSYINDLRLNEMATGDASGTWGTVTNTNLELIGESLGFGTEAIQTNANTHTSTIADGATDPARAMYIKYTGTLDSACTITIGPNTINRMHFIENATSGAQNIIIFQGTGSTVTIPNGDTKAVYLNGAASGAAVVDAFASLSVVDLKVQDDLTVTDDLIVNGDIDLEGSIDVNGTSNLDIVDIDGAVNMATTLLVTGETTLQTHLNMGDNDIIKLGDDADLQIKHDASNSFITDAGTGNLYLDSTVGNIYLRVNASENALEAVQDGAVTLYHNGLVRFATSVAGGTLGASGVNATLSTTSAGTSNLTLGTNSGNSITSGGNFNVLLGNDAGTALTTGDNNVAIGYEALKTEDAHGNNVAVGYQALKLQDAGDNAYNTAIGSGAGKTISTGAANTIIGGLAGDALTAGAANVAIGYQALTTEDGHGANTAVGYRALRDLNAGATGHNVAIGNDAGLLLNTGTINTLVGSGSGDAMTVGLQNVGVGFGSLGANVAGHKNVALGTYALYNMNAASSTNTFNTAVGDAAGSGVTSGVQNTLIGAIAGDAITDSNGNTALGYGALTSEQQGNKSTAVGWQALLSANRGSSGDSFNTAVGYNAGSSVSTGLKNTLIGGGSGSTITSGSSNVILGSYNGNSDGIDIRTGSNNIVLSNGDGSAKMHISADGDCAIGTAATGVKLTVQQTTGNQVVQTLTHDAGSNPYGLFINFSDASPDNNTNYFLRCVDSTATRLFIYSDGDIQNHDNSYGAISDVKLKEQIADASSQWDDIKALTVRKFKMKDDVATGDSDAHWRLGVIAQELETAGMNGLVKDNPDLDKNNEDLGTTTKSVKYSILYMKAVKALQEAMTRIETLESKVATLEG